ncbi:hypothetical protein A2U01_0063035 [Trifolium medium]|uniref:Uncharacterized protein n=1 Tax=Trifolium medium TaxID=97028 RepID=A0A392RYU5_9FABA|nr:hypothetical protein [Trifolium medium]
MDVVSANCDCVLQLSYIPRWEDEDCGAQGMKNATAAMAGDGGGERRGKERPQR